MLVTKRKRCFGLSNWYSRLENVNKKINSIPWLQLNWIIYINIIPTHIDVDALVTHNITKLISGIHCMNIHICLILLKFFV